MNPKEPPSQPSTDAIIPGASTAAALGTAVSGARVELELVAKDNSVEHLSLDIVPDASADFGNGFLGEGTPLARAILGKTAGSVVPYPQGDMREIRILAVSASQAQPAEDVASRRKARLQEAVEKSDRTSAMIFASSFSGKWGDYDPAGIEQWDAGKPPPQEPAGDQPPSEVPDPQQDADPPE